MRKLLFVAAILASPLCAQAQQLGRPTALQMLGSDIGTLIMQNASLQQQIGDMQDKIAALQKELESCRKPAPDADANPAK